MRPFVLETIEFSDRLGHHRRLKRRQFAIRGGARVFRRLESGVKVDLLVASDQRRRSRQAEPPSSELLREARELEKKNHRMDESLVPDGKRERSPAELSPKAPTSSAPMEGLGLLFAALQSQDDAPAPTSNELRPPADKPLSAFDLHATFWPFRPLGEGGLGLVWSVRDSALDREVALKQIRADQAHRPEARRRFIREARITGLLEHPSIIPVHGFSSHGTPFYTMRLLRGGTLRDAIEALHEQRKQGVDIHGQLRRLLRIYLRICDAIEYAHSKHVVHRDLKPANVVLGPFGEVFVLDWGLAKVLKQPDDSLVPLAPDPDEADETMDGQVIGTVAYMAPEQAVGKVPEIDQRTDVFGLGSILYSLLTGVAPYAGGSYESVVELFARAATGAFPPPREMVPGIPKPLEAICLKALAREREQRYQNVHALAEDVRHWLDNEPVSVYVDPLYVRMTRWAAHHPAVATAWIVSLVSFAVIVTIFATYAVNGSRLAIRRQSVTIREHVRHAAELTDQAMQWAPIGLRQLRETMPLSLATPPFGPGNLNLAAATRTLLSFLATDGDYTEITLLTPDVKGSELIRIVRNRSDATPHGANPRSEIELNISQLIGRALADPEHIHFGDWTPVTFGGERTVEIPVAAVIMEGRQPAAVVVVRVSLSKDLLGSFVAVATDDTVDGYLVDEKGTILAAISPQKAEFGGSESFADITADLLAQLASRPDSDEIFEDAWEDYEGLLFAKRVRFAHHDRSRWLLVAIGKAGTEINADVWRVLREVTFFAAAVVALSLIGGLVFARVLVRRWTGPLARND